MKNLSLIAAVAVLLIGNAAALIDATRNRSAVESEITLTTRELRYRRDPDNSGVELQLRWTNSNEQRWSYGENRLDQNAKPWFDEQKLRSIGFDCSVPASDQGAQEFYNRQIPRSAFVALEYNGPAWQAWLDAEQRRAEQAKARDYLENQLGSASRLVTIDIDRNPVTLRLRHPDRSSVLILPAVVQIWLNRAVSVPGRPAIPVRVGGLIQQIPSEIHVPRPLSREFEMLPKVAANQESTEDRYRVTLRFGRSLEPWVSRVELVRK